MSKKYFNRTLLALLLCWYSRSIISYADLSCILKKAGIKGEDERLRIAVEWNRKQWHKYSKIRGK